MGVRALENLESSGIEDFMNVHKLCVGKNTRSRRLNVTVFNGFGSSQFTAFAKDLRYIESVL